MELWSGLRARVAINLAAAASLTFGLLALVSLIVMQRAMRDTDDAGLAAAANLIAGDLANCADKECERAIIAGARDTGLTVELHDRPLSSDANRVVPARPGKPAHLSVERQVGNRVVEVEAPLGPMIGRARSAVSIMLSFLLLNAVLIVAIGTFLLNRGIVRRLAPITSSMSRIERFELDEPMMTFEGGDELGRMGGTLHRIRDRLREDKRRTTEYISELEKTNEELRETREGLARSERLATVGRLAAGVAHEVGNPIAAILGYLEILRRSQGVSTAEYVERIDREAKRVDRIVRDLLDFARQQPLSTGPVRVQAIVDGAARLVQPQPRWRSMKLSVDVPADLPLVVGQEHYGVQVLLNLLMNAADACQGKGTVTIQARQVGSKVEVSVSDDGPGIRAEDLGKLFDPFFTTKAPGEGVGLGLAISYRIMESFGGSIRAETRNTRGAVFILEFKTASVSSVSAAAPAR